MTIMRGTVEGVDAGAHTARVCLEGGAGVLEGVAILRVAHDAPLAPGDRVLVALWLDAAAVVLGAY